MASTIAIFADVSNLYYCIGRRFTGRKLDYEKLHQHVSKMGQLYRAVAYGTQIGDEAVSFITALKKIGYDTKYKKHKEVANGDKKDVKRACWDVGLTVDVVQLMERVDTIIIGSSNPDLAPLISYVKSKGVRCIVMACGIGRELKDLADQYIEIGEDLLETPKPA